MPSVTTWRSSSVCIDLTMPETTAGRSPASTAEQVATRTASIR